MKKLFSKIARTTVGVSYLTALTFLLLPVLLFTTDIEIFQSAIDFLNKDN